MPVCTRSQTPFKPRAVLGDRTNTGSTKKAHPPRGGTGKKKDTVAQQIRSPPNIGREDETRLARRRSIRRINSTTTSRPMQQMTVLLYGSIPGRLKLNSSHFLFCPIEDGLPTMEVAWNRIRKLRFSQLDSRAGFLEMTCTNMSKPIVFQTGSLEELRKLHRVFLDRLNSCNLPTMTTPHRLSMEHLAPFTRSSKRTLEACHNLQQDGNHQSKDTPARKKSRKATPTLNNKKHSAAALKEPTRRKRSRTSPPEDCGTKTATAPQLPCIAGPYSRLLSSPKTPPATKSSSLFSYTTTPKVHCSTASRIPRTRLTGKAQRILPPKTPATTPKALFTGSRIPRTRLTGKAQRIPHPDNSQVVSTRRSLIARSILDREDEEPVLLSPLSSPKVLFTASTSDDAVPNNISYNNILKKILVILGFVFCWGVLPALVSDATTSSLLQLPSASSTAVAPYYSHPTWEDDLLSASSTAVTPYYSHPTWEDEVLLNWEQSSMPTTNLTSINHVAPPPPPSFENDNTLRKNTNLIRGFGPPRPSFLRRQIIWAVDEADLDWIPSVVFQMMGTKLVEDDVVVAETDAPSTNTTTSATTVRNNNRPLQTKLRHGMETAILLFPFVFLL